MPTKSHPGIAREGWPIIAVTVAAGGVVWFFDPEWTLLFLVLALALALKFRDPTRPVPPEPLGVVSPVDGIVELVEKAQDPCLGRDAIRIRIRIARIGSYSARAPVEGKVLDFKGPEDSHGTCTTGQRGMRIQTDEHDDVILILNTAPSFARPRSLLGYGSRVGQGQRCALLRLARVAEVYVPTASRVHVEPGRRVLAASELLATLVHD